MKSTVESETSERLIAMGFSIISEFTAPSDNASDWQKKCINHSVIVSYQGTVFYNGPYSYGLGHLPGYNHNDRSVAYAGKVQFAIRKGKWIKNGKIGNATNSVPKPKLADVMYSLHSDASVIDECSFSDWCDSLGFNTDSITDKATYDTCLAQSLRFINVVPLSVRTELSELFEDY